jgi:hypothetical protein
MPQQLCPEKAGVARGVALACPASHAGAHGRGLLHHHLSSYVYTGSNATALQHYSSQHYRQATALQHYSSQHLQGPHMEHGKHPPAVATATSAAVHSNTHVPSRRPSQLLPGSVPLCTFCRTSCHRPWLVQQVVEPAASWLHTTRHSHSCSRPITSFCALSQRYGSCSPAGAALVPGGAGHFLRHIIRAAPLSCQQSCPVTGRPVPPGTQQPASLCQGCSNCTAPSSRTSPQIPAGFWWRSCSPALNRVPPRARCSCRPPPHSPLIRTAHWPAFIDERRKLLLPLYGKLHQDLQQQAAKPPQQYQITPLPCLSSSSTAC